MATRSTEKVIGGKYEDSSSLRDFIMVCLEGRVCISGVEPMCSPSRELFAWKVYNFCPLLKYYAYVFSVSVTFIINITVTSL
jgi:hypothetical protein